MEEPKKEKSEREIFLQLVYAAAMVGGFVSFIQMMVVGFAGLFLGWIN